MSSTTTTNVQQPEKKPTSNTIVVKTPKGTRDFGPFQMSIREKAFGIIQKCFKKHGAVTIDTPVFELKETLMGKYGEDSKLVYDLADQGGELLSLRYDLTVPFARYLATHGITNMKRYHIARVYRRDNPNQSKGRFREFYQCDFDIAGDYGLMLPDAECLVLASEILDQLQIGSYKIKINHRKLLDGIFEFCGVSQSQFRTICSSVDKLDKSPWDEVKKEMLDKGLDETTANKIGEYVVLKGQPKELLTRLKELPGLNENDLVKTALAQMDKLFEYTEVMGINAKLEFDMSLARGLDYYTGLILEAVLVNSETQLGSIAGGGRYDNLVGMFSDKTIPAVGFSIGIERIFTIMEEKAMQNPGSTREKETQVLVCTVGGPQLVTDKLRICKQLWDAGIPAEFLYQENRSIRQQLTYANDNKIPYVALLGPDEKEKGVIQIKTLFGEKKEALVVPIDQLAEQLKQLLNM